LISYETWLLTVMRDFDEAGATEISKEWKSEQANDPTLVKRLSEEYIHLKYAYTYLEGAGPFMFPGGGLWRMRLAAVSGWYLGKPVPHLPRD
jgi:hypothetical protein